MVSASLCAEQNAAPDCLQRPLLRRSRFRQQLTPSDGSTVWRHSIGELALLSAGRRCPHGGQGVLVVIHRFPSSRKPWAEVGYRLVIGSELWQHPQQFDMAVCLLLQVVQLWQSDGRKRLW